MNKIDDKIVDPPERWNKSKKKWEKPRESN